MIFGAGPIGIGLWFALRGKGLETVFVVEPSATRRDAVAALGAKTLDPMAIDVPAFIADHTDGRGADAAFDAAGVAPAVQAALASVGARKPTICVAIYEKPLVTPLVEPRDERIPGAGLAVLHVCRLRGGHRADGPGRVRHHRLGDTDLDDDVVDEGFEALHAGAKMKVLVDPTI